MRTPDNQLNFCPIVAALSHKLYISNDHDNIKKCLNTELIQFISGLKNAWYSRVVQKLNELSLFVGITSKEENLSNAEKCLLETVTNTLFVNPQTLENRPNNFVVATIVFLRQTEATRGVVYGGKKRRLSETVEAVSVEPDGPSPTKWPKITGPTQKTRRLSLGLGRRADITTRILGHECGKRSIRQKRRQPTSRRSMSPPPTEGASKTIKIMVVFIKEYLEFVGVTDKTLQISKEVTLNKPTYTSNLDNKTSSLALLAFHDVLRELFDVVGV